MDKGVFTMSKNAINGHYWIDPSIDLVKGGKVELSHPRIYFQL